MRILILADIHANWPALEAIIRHESFDECWCVGDLVDYGPFPVECIEWVRENCRYVVRGNHDHAVAQFVNGRGDDGYRYLARVTREWTWSVLKEDHLRFLAKLPVTQDITRFGRTIQLVHATPRDPLDEYLGPNESEWAERLNRTYAQLLCVGHTHLPFLLEVEGKAVLNPGSVGQPRDGDPRASYAVLNEGRIELHRVEYPTEVTAQAIRNANWPERARELAIATLMYGGVRQALRAGVAG